MLLWQSLLLLYVISAFILASICSTIASRRKYNVAKWFFMGLLCPPLVLILVLYSPQKWFENEVANNVYRQFVLMLPKEEKQRFFDLLIPRLKTSRLIRSEFTFKSDKEFISLIDELDSEIKKSSAIWSLTEFEVLYGHFDSTRIEYLNTKKL